MGTSASDELRAAGALLGLSVTVVDGDRWELVEAAADATVRPGLTVGRDWYARRGHPEREAVALVMLTLWGTLRADRVAPARVRRARSLAAARPELVPLVDAVARLQAEAELLAAFPGLRGPLASALARSLPAAPAEEPRHLQWTLALLSGAAAGERPAPRYAPEVLAELSGLRARSGLTDPVRRVCAPDPARAPLERLERALALLLPPYERLLAADLADRGLDPGAAPDGAAEAQPHSGGARDDELGEAGGGEAAEAAVGAPDRDDAETRPPGAENAGDPEPGEPPASADALFEVARDRLADRIATAPRSAERALSAASAALDAEARAAAPRRDGAAGATATPDAPSAARDAEYRERAERLALPIERMRAVWAEVIAERVARVPRLGRRPQPEGELLARDAMPAAVAEARAGRPRPAAYLARERRPHRTRRAGSTDYVLLVDRSASMQGRAAEAAADAALVMLEGLAGVERDIRHAEERAGVDLELDLRTALIVFDARPRLVKPLSGGLDDAVRREMFAEIRAPRGSTDDAAALREAARALGLPGAGGPAGGAPGSAAGGDDARAVAGPGAPRPVPAGDGLERRRIVLVVSDGGTNDADGARRELRRLRAAGAQVHGIGIGSDDVVARYAPTSERVDDPRDLASAIRRLVESGAAAR